MSATTPIVRPMAMAAIPPSISGTGIVPALAAVDNSASNPINEDTEISFFIGKLRSKIVSCLFIFYDDNSRKSATIPTVRPIPIAAGHAAVNLGYTQRAMQYLCRQIIYSFSQVVNKHWSCKYTVNFVSNPDIILDYLTDNLLIHWVIADTRFRILLQTPQAHPVIRPPIDGEKPAD